MITHRFDFALLILSCCLVSVLADTRQHREVIGTQTYQGIEVELAIEPVIHGSRLNLNVGETVRFLISIRDTTSGQPISGLFPAAWVQSRPENIARKPNAKKMVEAFISGGIFAQPDIDLNVYHVLSLNDDNSISVVDPLFGFGGSKLVTMIALPSPGKDWIRMTRASKLFVSLPESNQIALIDTSSWSISTLMPQVNHPTRLFLQPDEHFLWASIPGGVAVFNTAPFTFQYLLPTGNGEHAIAFSPDNRFAYVTNAEDGTLSIVKLSEFKVSKTIRTGEEPTSVAYDSRARSVYVTHKKSGTIACIDGSDHEIYKTITAEPGIAQIRFAPQGRWGFLVNPKTNRLSLVDSALDRIVQTGLVESGPSEIAFSDNFAYIRHIDSPTLLLVPLDGQSLGVRNQPIPVVEIPGGDAAYGMLPQATPASSIVQAPGSNAVLIANPKDRSIYFYKEGMAAPMGSFNNYGREPRAILVIDRSLRERTGTGVYETIGKLEKAGISDIAVFTDTPRMSLGFEIEVGKATSEGEKLPIISLQSVSQSMADNKQIIAGEATEIKFKATSSTEFLPSQLRHVTFMTAGAWRKRQNVNLQPDGTFTLKLTPPLPGLYQTIFESHSSQFRIQESKKHIFRATSKNR